jgi:hypothetical protein
VAAPDRVRSQHAELFFQRRDENLEAVEEERVRRTDDLRDLGVDERADDDRPHAFDRRGLVDARDDFVCFLDCIDERQRHFLKRNAVELSEQAVPEHLGSNTGAIRDKKRSAFLDGHGIRR